ncbi:hypothetical protein J40TS1_21470 [Paenibacillus montaniterrae]|uniref:Oligosaccharide repeat unit polymerase n=1 Tax=Paenibacillus montaniterrae TaxID=429341 RepID=A0A920CXN5_9BACL|nr:O-antigen polymerase [Paenibacillus montaniterrae]GIP16505.1 hypothetical protein J40TS1_21470 [Paenibacillus montaniterrae]
MSNINVQLSIYLLLLNLISMILSINNLSNIALFISIITCIGMIYWSKVVTKYYTNATVIFITFAALYGLSGPISVAWGDGLNKIFSTENHLDTYLFVFALSNIGFITGVLLFHLGKKQLPTDNKKVDTFSEKLFSIRQSLIKASLMLVIISLLFEMINIYRVGGLSQIFMGKAQFQSAVSELSLSLPSSEFLLVAMSLFSLYLGILRTKNKKFKECKNLILLFIILSLPHIGIKLILGQRGILLSLFICLIIGLTYFLPIKRIKPKLVIIISVLYILMSFIFANRSIVSLITEDFNLFIKTATQKERLIEALNPSSNEFGSTFGNFNQFLSENEKEFPLYMGETYIKGLVLPIPSFVYPGEKPIQITYEFRDQYFSSEASRGRIAGTGFSSLLEAFMNFKYIGVFVIYLLLAFVLRYLDEVFRYKTILFSVFYVAGISQTVSFHRSAFGTIYSNLFIIFIITIISIMIMKLTRKNSI